MSAEVCLAQSFSRRIVIELWIQKAEIFQKPGCWSSGMIFALHDFSSWDTHPCERSGVRSSYTPFFGLPIFFDCKELFLASRLDAFYLKASVANWGWQVEMVDVVGAVFEVYCRLPKVWQSQGWRTTWSMSSLPTNLLKRIEYFDRYLFLDL